MITIILFAYFRQIETYSLKELPIKFTTIYVNAADEQIHKLAANSKVALGAFDKAIDVQLKAKSENFFFVFYVR